MTCLCKFEFCYICGGPYEPKTCECPQFNEEDSARELNELVEYL